ncbi:MAG: RDD family protein, partial [Pseudomonadota bacterium]
IFEANSVGEFRWVINRAENQSADMFSGFISIICFFAAYFYYFSIHLIQQRQTIGQYLLGFKIVNCSSTHQTHHKLRIFLSLIGISWWPISIVLALNSPTKRFWWDRIAGYKAIRIIHDH